jgi:hypothetical protein
MQKPGKKAISDKVLWTFSQVFVLPCSPRETGPAAGNGGPAYIPFAFI